MIFVKITLVAAVLMLSTQAFAQLSCGIDDVSALSCSDREVKTLIQDIKKYSAGLKCRGVVKAELETMKRSWGRTQSACIHSPDVRTCVVESLKSEKKYFQEMKTCRILSKPVRFDSVEPSYVLAHPAVFTDGEIEIVGRLKMSDCSFGSTSVSGKLYEYLKDQVYIEVEFKSMPAAQREFLCTKEPFSSWKGVVNLTPQGTPYLYATEVLGVVLP